MCDPRTNVRFVREVEKHPALYNYKLPVYSRKDITEKAWQEVAAKVNIPVPECKEKWRNLRTVFIRKMKPQLSGSGTNRRKYYLAEAMQFYLPFIKTLGCYLSENISEVPQHKTNTEILENGKTCYDSASLENSSDIVESSQTPPTHSSCYPPKTSENTVLPQHSAESSLKCSSTGAKRSLMLENKSAADVDVDDVTEHVKVKKTKLETTVNNEANSSHNTKEYLKMYLFSLIPELEQFDHAQLKLFRRRILNIIDEISNSSQPRCLSLITLLLPQTGSSNVSHTSDPSIISEMRIVSESIQPEHSGSQTSNAGVQKDNPDSLLVPKQEIVIPMASVTEEVVDDQFETAEIPIKVKEEFMEAAETSIEEKNGVAEFKKSDEGEDTEFDLFCKSMAKHLKTMPLATALKTQMVIEKLVTEEKNKCDSENS